MTVGSKDGGWVSEVVGEAGAEEKMEAPSCSQLLERQQVGQQATR